MKLIRNHINTHRCAPGGYSRYVLETNRSATGTGITLPLDDGGHQFLIHGPLLSRYTVHFADLTRYNLSESDEEPTPIRLPPLPFKSSTRFDLAILDGHCLYFRPFGPQIPHMLLVSQLIIALQFVAERGTLFMKLKKLAREMPARVVFLLDSIGLSTATIKPRTIHVNRGTFYVVVKGVKRGPQLNGFLAKLRSFRRKMLDDPDLDCYTACEDVVPRGIIKETYILRLMDLGNPVWKAQLEFLERFLRKMGIL